MSKVNRFRGAIGGLVGGLLFDAPLFVGLFAFSDVSPNSRLVALVPIMPIVVSSLGFGNDILLMSRGRAVAFSIAFAAALNLVALAICHALAPSPFAIIDFDYAAPVLMAVSIIAPLAVRRTRLKYENIGGRSAHKERGLT